MVLLIIKIPFPFKALPTQLSPSILTLDGAQNETLSASWNKPIKRKEIKRNNKNLIWVKRRLVIFQLPDFVYPFVSFFFSETELPQEPILKHPQPMCFLQGLRPS